MDLQDIEVGVSLPGAVRRLFEQCECFRVTSAYVDVPDMGDVTIELRGEPHWEEGKETGVLIRLLDKVANKTSYEVVSTSNDDGFTMVLQAK